MIQNKKYKMLHEDAPTAMIFNVNKMTENINFRI